MKNRLVACVLCILMLAPLSATAFAVDDPTTVPQPPAPGYCPTPRQTATAPDRISRHPAAPSGTARDIIVEIISQVDETVYLEYLTDLVGFGPRSTGSAACIASAAFIYNEFVNASLWTRYHHWSNGGYSSDNVEATLNGTDESSNDIYIICGHYDTVSSSPGADDDGSGTVAVMLAARILSTYSFNFTIKFVAFSGEEQGLLGSEIYAQQAAAAGWDIIGVLNCDMISYAVTTYDGSNVIVFENTASEWLYQYTLTVNTQYASYIGLTLTHGGSTWGSDHNSFWDVGYDALFYFEKTETPYYHGPGDTIDHINATYAKKNVRLVLATLALLAQASYLSDPPVAPTLDGPSIGFLYYEMSFTVAATDPNTDDVYYLVDWKDGTTSGWVGPFDSGQQATIGHTWNTEGVYDVTARAKDINGVPGPWCTPHPITIVDNAPPTPPSITGPEKMRPRVDITFQVASTDPQGQDLSYEVDWGDGTMDTYDGPYASGETINVTHAWMFIGMKTVKVRATDSQGLAGDWGMLQVKVPYEMQHPFLLLLQQVLRAILSTLRGD